MEEDVVRTAQTYRHINGELGRSHLWLAKYLTFTGALMIFGAIFFPWGDGETHPQFQLGMGSTLLVGAGIWWAVARDNEKRLLADKLSIEKMIAARGYILHSDGTVRLRLSSPG